MTLQYATTLIASLNRPFYIQTRTVQCKRCDEIEDVRPLPLPGEIDFIVGNKVITEKVENIIEIRQSMLP